ERIESCLNSIKKSSLINIEETYMVEKEVITESGRKIIKEQEATFDEKTLIIATRGKVCTKFKCKNIGGIVVTNRYDAFLNAVNTELKKHNILKHRQVYKFGFMGDLKETLGLYQGLFDSKSHARKHTNQKAIEKATADIQRNSIIDDAIGEDLLDLLVSIY
ncbi:hypothetical protein NP590_20465, partial [Methylomonas sp. SURF-2]